MRYIILSILLLSSLSLWTQSKMVISTIPMTSSIIIDGKLSEPDWMNAETSSEFTQIEPNPDQPSRHDTKVKVLYSKDALYIGMEMLDSAPDSILHQLSERDDFGNTSWAGVIIGGFQDGINAFEFFVTVEGVQFDASITTFGEDSNWNTVWSSATKLTDNGWVIEMKIPYSAIRFPEKDIQEWDINFIRNTRRYKEKSFWNPLDLNLNGFVNQMGVIKGIKDIEPATRLFFYPYTSIQYDTFADDEGSIQSDLGFSAGMDLKYGINNSYTLDMTLIPDFAQVASDDQILNLSPFEVKFNENRQFFTEGTELFNKADLFYSRRIGAKPINIDKAYDMEDDGYDIISNPNKVSLINALKVSGRNTKGLGIGFFNAITNKTIAVLKDSIGNEVEVETAPLTNYNVLAFDQNLKNNSYISLINTNVTRKGSTYDANATAIAFDLRDKKQKYKLEGVMAYNFKSNFDNEKEKDGYAYNIDLAMIKGKLNYGINYTDIGSTYDPNDLGYLSNNNEKSTEIWINYDQFEPGKHYNKYWLFGAIEYNTLSQSNAFTNIDLEISAGRNNKHFHSMGVEISLTPIGEHDYFETRDISRYYAVPAIGEIFGWLSTDYRKKLAIDLGAGIEKYDKANMNILRYRIAPRYRINNHLSLRYIFYSQHSANDQGYVTKESDEIIFGRRDVDVRTNILSGNYVFNNKMGLTFRLRHYWSKLKLKEFYSLDNDGELIATDYDSYDSDGHSNDNSNYNSLTSDVGWRWVFSPGSELSLVWKTSLYTSESEIPQGFSKNFDTLMELTNSNSFSIKILYYIDYLSLKK